MSLRGDNHGRGQPVAISLDFFSVSLESLTISYQIVTYTCVMLRPVFLIMAITGLSSLSSDNELYNHISLCCYVITQAGSFNSKKEAFRVIILERFSIGCRKTKTKVITTANQNKGKFQREPMRTQSKYR